MAYNLLQSNPSTEDTEKNEKIKYIFTRLSL